MRIRDFDEEFARQLEETASVGATSAGNVASVTGAFWMGPTKGVYPYIEPDMRTHKKTATRRKRRKRSTGKVVVLRR